MKVCFRTKTLSLDLKFIFAGVQAIIFVVDSNDIQRLEVAKKELHKVMQEEALKEAVLLVLANKQDLKMAASVATVADTLGLRSLENRKWLVFLCSFSPMLSLPKVYSGYLRHFRKWDFKWVGLAGWEIG